ncbi:hypothetical protein [Delftia sp. ASV31]|jgi:hypothetical protein|uniref:hypothetical protein n=1 Tax=Delftia sp. ASV31 TaxID=2795113 RepID=UPI0018EC0F8E|nr:hypothetical protein [Delftia sp. ASV31]
MSIDIEAIVTAAVNSAAKAVKDTGPEVRDILSKIMQGHDAAIRSLAEMFADGEIDEETFKDEMNDEAKLLQADFLVIAVVSKAIAQKAVNTFRKALIDGITSAIKAAI